jgi:cell division protease FtsH
VTSDVLLRRETIEREQFIQLLEGKSEEDVFGPDEPVYPQGTPPPAPEAPARKPERKPAPLPRPGLAGGTAELRGLDTPEKPELP